MLIKRLRGRTIPKFIWETSKIPVIARRLISVANQRRSNLLDLAHNLKRLLVNQSIIKNYKESVLLLVMIALVF